MASPFFQWQLNFLGSCSTGGDHEPESRKVLPAEKDLLDWLIGPSLDSQQETIHIPNFTENSSNVLFLFELEQKKNIWFLDSKREGVSKEPCFG